MNPIAPLITEYTRKADNAAADILREIATMRRNLDQLEERLNAGHDVINNTHPVTADRLNANIAEYEHAKRLLEALNFYAEK